MRRITGRPTRRGARKKKNKPPSSKKKRCLAVKRYVSPNAAA
jgi:hypothetical protein